MKNQKLMIAVLLGGLSLSGCSDPMNIELPQNSKEINDFQAQMESKLEGEDERLILEFVGENLFALTVGMLPEGMTVGDAIAVQKEQEAKAEEK